GPGVLRAGVNLSGAFDLRRSQARWICRVRKDPASSTLEDRWIEVAAEDILDDPVLEAVKRVACVERRPMNRRVLARRDDTLWRLVCRLPLHHEAESLVPTVVGGRAREDRVEVGRVALRFLERHASATRAAREVRQLRPHAVEVGDRGLSVDRRQMLRAIAPVDDLIRMAGGPLRARAG